MEIIVGRTYRHFKGALYKVIAIATHSETDEKLVIYTRDDKVWARPYDMFASKVDKEKYPDVEQGYRFELIDD